MIGPSVIMLITGIFLVFITPIERAIAHRRGGKQLSIGSAELTPREVAARSARVAHLFATADAELERDPLIRGVRGICEIYDRA